MSYLVHSEIDRKKMFKEIKISKIEDLFKSIPKNIFKPEIKLPDPLSEKEMKEKLIYLGNLNNPVSKFSSFLGGGAYNHYIPSVVKSIQNISQFYTTYTPYQAEISQGTLQYIFEFQSLICRLTGMDISNASMYDGATSLAEAILMAKRITGKNKVCLSRTIHPEYRQTCKTYCIGKNILIDEIDYKDGKTNLDLLNNSLSDEIGAVIIQNPNFFGCFEDVFYIKELVAKYPKCLFIVTVNPISLGLIKSPSDYGADIVVGEGQVFGNPLSFGGPYLGFFVTKEQYLRQVPGRIVGKTVDTEGSDAYVLTFQTREQHIRKFKATSNICSNHSLNALAATVFLTLIGENGLKKIGNICLQRSHYFMENIKIIDKFELKFNSQFFNELVISSEIGIKKILKDLHKEKILGGIYLDDYYPELKNCMLVSITEMNSIEEIDRYIRVLKEF